MAIYFSQSMEAQKLELVAKGKERAQIAQANKEKEVEIKTKATQEKIRRSMEVNKENREAQIQALQGRLRDHVRFHGTLILIYVLQQILFFSV